MRLSTTVTRITPVLALVALAAMTLASTAAFAQTWSEIGDAGNLTGTAQITVGTGALTQINGDLPLSDDVDLYCIRLTSVPPANAPLLRLGCIMHQGPNLWLFDAAGNGVFTNMTCSTGFKTILAPNSSLPTGTYYVAVSYFGRDPQSSLGAIWAPAILGQRAPDGPGAAGSLIGWAGIVQQNPINPYQINLNYFGHCDDATPVAPASWGALRVIYRD